MNILQSLMTKESIDPNNHNMKSIMTISPGFSLHAEQSLCHSEFPLSIHQIIECLIEQRVIIIIFVLFCWHCNTYSVNNQCSMFRSHFLWTTRFWTQPFIGKRKVQKNRKQTVFIIYHLRPKCLDLDIVQMIIIFHHHIDFTQCVSSECSKFGFYRFDFW